MTERSIFWRRHLETIDAEGISTVAYGERERLSLGSLYQWRQKLKSDFGIAISQAPTSSSGFVAVRVTEHYEANTSWSLRGGGSDASRRSIYSSIRYFLVVAGAMLLIHGKY